MTVGLNGPSFETHVLATQVSPAAQTTPQPPQLFGSLVVLRQPAGQHVSAAGQAGPPLHVVGTLQTLATQVSPAGQALPHAPQFFVSVVVSEQPEVQQSSVPVQTGPPLQVAGAWHVPPLHVSPVAQTLPHAPQLFGSVLTSLQPLVQHWVCPVQSGPPLQLAGGVQAPVWQVKDGGQTLPQALQFFGSVSMLVQPALQHCSSPVQTGPPWHEAGGVQMPATHVSPVEHLKPHWLQLFGSVCRSLQPVPQHCWLPVQVGPPLHVAAWQVPPTQALPVPHVLPQNPQLFESLVRSAQKIAGPALQQLRPPGHVQVGFWQTAPTHVAPGAQELPHWPQLLGSLSMSTQPAGQHWSVPEQDGPWLQRAGAVQTPATQVSPAGQTLSQPLQLFGSVSMSVQPVAQHCWTPVQIGPPLQEAGAVQLPATHVSPVGQPKPQVLQLFGSVFTSVQPEGQQESAPVQVGPPLQVPGVWQKLSAQTEPVGQTLPQKPQLELEVVVSTQKSPQHVSGVGQPVDWQLVPGMHSCVVGLQSSPVGQVFGFVRHATQTPAGSSQNGVAGVEAQSPLLVQRVGGLASPSFFASVAASTRASGGAPPSPTCA